VSLNAYRKKNDMLLFDFGFQLFPFYPEDPTILNRTETLIKELQPDEQVLSRLLKEMLDDLKRARACRQLALTVANQTS
jgi:hypothetical protein